MSERDKIVVQKMIEYCNQVSETHAFFHDDKTFFYDMENGFVYRNSLAMAVFQIGELTKNLTDDFRKQHRRISWKAIAGIRDVFAHHYGSLDYDELWKTSHGDICELRGFLSGLLNDSTNGSNSL